MKIIVINGCNLNLIGIREPEIYGNESYASLNKRLKAYAKQKKVQLKIMQSNHEGDLVDAVQLAHRFDGIVINPAAYTHTSIALYDALRGVRTPACEVHISDPDARETFRHVNYIRPACVATFSGHGVDAYFEAIDYLLDFYGKDNEG